MGMGPGVEESERGDTGRRGEDRPEMEPGERHVGGRVHRPLLVLLG
jgi:hypothetical protein